ncbi:MAG: thiamine phosphate synthase [Spirochaetaceae bacterium]|nr:MAG: thiamine phosphate synthase [Spirochaetaceae bacterium]
MKGYYFITDSNLSLKGNEHDLKSALAENVKLLQYRAKDISSGKMYDEALLLNRICKNSGKKAIFIVNDRVDIAMAVDAGGVHLGQEDLPCGIVRKILGKGKIIGVTVHSVEEALEAQKEGADYIAASPVFPTQTKNDAGFACGTGFVSEMKKYITIPVIAIGGINLKNARQVIDAGADMICAISAVVASENTSQSIRCFQEMFL